MGFKIIFSPESLEHLGEIVRYIAQDKPDAALRFGMKMLDRAALLAEFPELGQPYAKRPGVRRLLVKPYFIYYRVRYEIHAVEILEFWHGARRDPVLL
jgi:plasmid stabilization system protein ParE